MPTRPVETRRGLVRQDHAEVEIAVRTAIATGGGAEQIDTLRVVVVHQTTRDLRDGLVLGHAPLLCTENAGTREDTHCRPGSRRATRRWHQAPSKASRMSLRRYGSRRIDQPGFGQ